MVKSVIQVVYCILFDVPNYTPIGAKLSVYQSLSNFLDIAPCTMKPVVYGIVFGYIELYAKQDYIIIVQNTLRNSDLHAMRYNMTREHTIKKYVMNGKE